MLFTLLFWGFWVGKQGIKVRFLAVAHSPLGAGDNSY